MKKESIISKVSSLLRSNKNNDEETKNFGIIGIDLNDNQPGDLFISFQCSPHETLGIIEHMISILKTHKKRAQNVLDEHYGNKKDDIVVKQYNIDDAEKYMNDLIESLPENIKQEVIALEKKLREAFEEGDVKKMIEVKNEMLNLKKKYLDNIDNYDLDKSEENDNDINDFK